MNGLHPLCRHTHEHSGCKRHNSSLCPQDQQRHHTAAFGWQFLALDLYSSAGETFAVHVSVQAPACQWPICKRSFLLTQSLCCGSFSVRWGAVIFSFKRQSHWHSVCCFTRQWLPFKRNGQLLARSSNSALSWEEASALGAPPPPPCTSNRPFNVRLEKRVW